MEKIKTIIVDDEVLSRKRILNLLKEFPEIDVVDECETGSQAINSILKFCPNLIYLDIQLNDVSGFDLIELIPLEKRPTIIFVSAFDEYALEAFDLSALDYLLKPFKDERFVNSTKKAIDSIKRGKLNFDESEIQKIIEHFQNPVTEFLKKNKNKIAIKLTGKILFLDQDKVLFIKASGDYVEVFAFDKKYVIRESLTSFMNQINENEFCRVHRSTIINLSSVKEIVFSNYGEIDVKMEGDHLFRVSKSYRKDFQRKMNF